LGQTDGGNCARPDGRWLAAGTWDDEVAVYDTSTWERPAVLRPPDDGIYGAVQSIAFSDDGRHLAVGAKDGFVQVWDVAKRAVVRTLVGQAEGQAQWINGVAFAPGRDTLAYVSGDSTLRLWQPGSGAQRAVLHGHAGPVLAIASSRDGQTLFTGGADGTVRAWSLGAGDPSRRQWNTRENMPTSPSRLTASARPPGGTGW
jgi:WD40 repeat protein